jgi:hypothetical protein
VRVTGRTEDATRLKKCHSVRFAFPGVVKIENARRLVLGELLTRSIERSRRRLPMREAKVLSLRADTPTASGPEVPPGTEDEFYDEKGINWVGVCIAVVGLTLMVLSFMLGSQSL